MEEMTPTAADFMDEEDLEIGAMVLLLLGDDDDCGDGVVAVAFAKEDAVDMVVAAAKDVVDVVGKLVSSSVIRRTTIPRA